HRREHARATDEARARGELAPARVEERYSGKPGDETRGATAVCDPQPVEDVARARAARDHLEGAGEGGTGAGRGRVHRAPCGRCGRCGRREAMQRCRCDQEVGQLAHSSRIAREPVAAVRETWLVLDLDRLRSELDAACADAGVGPGAVVVFVVPSGRPEGTTPLADLTPAGEVRPDPVAGFRAVGSARAARHAGTAPRLAVWRDLPGFPDTALGPMLRHELEHARRFE